MYSKKLYILFFLLLSFLCSNAQDSIPVLQKSKSVSRSSSAVMKLSQSLEEGKTDKEIAADYMKVAKEFSSKGEYSRAEDYLNRAKSLYEKLKDKENLANVEREIAKVQEAQGKVSEAITSYGNASKLTKKETLSAINANDKARLSNINNPQAQSKLIQQNIDLTEKTQNSEDRSLALRQMAQVNKEMEAPDLAIENLEQAYEEMKEVQPEEALKIKQEIASTYAADNQMEKAIAINKDLVAESQKIGDPKAEIQQLQDLSSNLLEANKPEEALSVLLEAYKTAIEKGQAIEAKNSLEMIVEQYKKQKNPQKAIEAYNDFINQFETLVKGDSTLIDEKFFQVQEDKILQLEKERALKDALIKKSNIFNYALIGIIILILIFLIFIAKALYSIKKKNKKIALQSLRREMNPHFIFNSLNSVNQFIAQNKELEANKYLSSYSKLMRNVMENSNKDFIPLSTEIEQMKEYLDLEYMRFSDKFKYNINIDSSVDTDSVYIPNMLIQPQLENAIWHGLRYKEGIGLLTLTIKKENDHLKVIVEDNGIGIKKSQELKTKHQRKHHSRGMTNTNERIELLNSLYNTDISIRVTDKQNNETGVIVTLQFPIMDKNK